MGLGTTLSVLSLVMRGVEARRAALNGPVDIANVTAPTLVVCPLSVLQVWADQVFTLPPACRGPSVRAAAPARDRLHPWSVSP